MALRGSTNVIVTLIGSYHPFLVFCHNPSAYFAFPYQHLGFSVSPLKYLAQKVSQPFTNDSALVWMIQNNSN